MNTESKIRYLEMIEHVIDRMANNSFMLKGWAITLTVAIIGINVHKLQVTHIVLVCLISCIFLILDAYYLWQERLYRTLFNHVRGMRADDITFDLSASKYNNEKWWKSFCCSLFSATEIVFYLPLAVVAAVIIKCTLS